MASEEAAKAAAGSPSIDGTSPDYWYLPAALERLARYHRGGRHPVHIGELYGARYKILGKLGHGARSTTWLARDVAVAVGAGRYVALKFGAALSPLGAGDPDFRNTTTSHRDLRAIGVLWRLNAAACDSGHPGGKLLLRLSDHFFVGGANGEHPVLATEIMGRGLGGGTTSADFADGGSFLATACRQLLQALDFIHQQGVVHGDLQPTNIVLSTDNLSGQSERAVLERIGPPQLFPLLSNGDWPVRGSLPSYVATPVTGILENYEHPVAKIIGFGDAFFAAAAARPARPASALPSRTSEEMLCTLSRGRVDADWGRPADIWALGCTVLELATGSILFDLPAGADADALHARLPTALGPLPRRWWPYCAPDQFTDDSPAGGVRLEESVRRVLEEGSWEIPGTPELFADFLRQTLSLDPRARASAAALLRHPWLRSAAMGGDGTGGHERPMPR